MKVFKNNEKRIKQDNSKPRKFKTKKIQNQKNSKPKEFKIKRALEFHDCNESRNGAS